jgi:hypothetical protein
MNITDNTILDCGHKPSKHSNFTTGYGTNKDGKTFCYDCCAYNDVQQMLNNKSIVLYLVKNNNQYQVTNWPASLKFNLYGNPVIGKHNIAGTQTHVYFKLYGTIWHGVQYGDNSQLCYCKQTKLTR